MENQIKEYLSSLHLMAILHKNKTQEGNLTIYTLDCMSKDDQFYSLGLVFNQCELFALDSFSVIETPAEACRKFKSYTELAKGKYTMQDVNSVKQKIKGFLSLATSISSDVKTNHFELINMQPCLSPMSHIRMTYKKDNIMQKPLLFFRGYKVLLAEDEDYPEDFHNFISQLPNFNNFIWEGTICPNMMLEKLQEF